MFVTWRPEAKRLRVHFRTTISDGEYKYAGGVNIDLGPRATRKEPTAKAGSSVRQYGLRYGTQFGIDFGTAYEVAPSGKIEKTLTLPIANFTNEIKEPPIFNRGGAGTRAFRGVSTARIRR